MTNEDEVINHHCYSGSQSFGWALQCKEKETEEGLELRVEAGEYGYRVNYCPLCGYEAENKTSEYTEVKTDE